MKTAFAFLTLGLFLRLVAPFFWADFISSVAVTLPQFVWSKSPPRTFEFNGTTLFRIAGGLFVILAIPYFIFFRGSPFYAISRAEMATVLRQTLV